MSVDRSDDGCEDRSPSGFPFGGSEGDEPPNRNGDDGGTETATPAEGVRRDELERAVAVLESGSDDELTVRQRAILEELAASIARTVAPAAREVLEAARTSDARADTEDEASLESGRGA